MGAVMYSMGGHARETEHLSKVIVSFIIPQQQGSILVGVCQLLLFVMSFSGASGHGIAGAETYC